MSNVCESIAGTTGDEAPAPAIKERKKRRTGGLRGAGFIASAQVTTPVPIKDAKAAKPEESEEPLFLRAETYNVSTELHSIDESIFKGNALIQHLRVRPIHTTVMRDHRTPSGTTAVKVDIDEKGTTFTDITIEVLRKLEPDTDWKAYRPQLNDYERQFLEEAHNSPSSSLHDDSVSRHIRAPLIRGLDAFREAAFNFHQGTYDDLCHGATQFGAFLLDQEPAKG